MSRTLIYTPAVPQSSVTGDTQTTIKVEGARESIEDIVGLISPWETPCYTAFRKTEATDHIHYWQEDDLAAPSRTNAQVQGFDPPASFTTSSPAMKSNWLQLFSATARVSGTAMAAKFYGRASELDYQEMKRGREIRRDIESVLLNEAATGTIGAAPAITAFNTGTAGKMQSISRCIYTVAGTYASAGMAGNWNVGAAAVITGAAADTGGQTNVTTSGGQRTLSESLVLTTQQTIYNNGGNPNQLIVTPNHSTIVANFAYIDPTGTSNVTGRARLTDERTVVNVVEVYVSPFGTMAVMVDRFMWGAISGDAEAMCLLLETDKWFIAQLRPISSEPLAKTGDNVKSLVTAEMTVGTEHTKCSGVIRDLTA